MSEMREAFERWFLESRKSKGASRRPTFERMEDGTYADDHTQRHWWTWQNAQAARIAELEAELTEQARIVGMGAERELALIAERDQLRAEVERLRPNATRYEFLRDAKNAEQLGIHDARIGDDCPFWLIDEHADAAIDRAIEAAKEDK